MAEAGWYPDPQRPGTTWWWDGTRWTGHAQSTTPPPRPRWRGPVLAALVVALAAGGAVAGLLRPGDDPPVLTFQGAPVVDAAATLQHAETAVVTAARRRHGATSDATRCYFSRPAKATSTDIDESLFCGPVLFVGGDHTREYLGLGLANTGTADRATLTAATPDASSTLVALPADERLLRPDNRRPPRGDGGLHAPVPPPALRDVVVNTALDGSQHPRELSSARMVGRTQGLQITAAGYVSHYGVGEGARSAPKGERLLAIQLSDLDGEFAAKPVEPVLRVSGSSHLRPLTIGEPGSWNVAAIPSGSTATVELTDSGLTQSLAVPSGRPGAHNIAVLARENRTTDIQRTFSVPLRISGPGGSETVTVKAVAKDAALAYWAYDRPKYHASGPGRALLFVQVSYTDPAHPGTKYAFDTSLLHLELPGGLVVRAHDISTDDKYVVNVFDVPASLTRATVSISGSSRTDGIVESVSRPASFGLDFPSG